MEKKETIEPRYAFRHNNKIASLFSCLLYKLKGKRFFKLKKHYKSVSCCYLLRIAWLEDIRKQNLILLLKKFNHFP